MRTSLVGGIDVGTRRIRLVTFNCSTKRVELELAVTREELLEALKLLKGIGVEKVCVAAGLQWRELEGVEIYRDPLSLLGASERETHGFRRLISLALFKEVVVLPSGGGSGEVPKWNLFNSVDTGTPDKVAKSNYLIHLKGLKDFTLIDDGCFTSIIEVRDKALTFVLGSTRGVPGKCSPGCVDAEIFLGFKWPREKADLTKCKPPMEVVNGWLEFLRPSLREPLIFGSQLPESAAAIGSALWCCGVKPENFFGDSPRYFCEPIKELAR